MSAWGTHWRQRLRLLPLYAALRLADVARPAPGAQSKRSAPIGEGVSVVIPERGTPELLLRALDSLAAACEGFTEPLQPIVVVNGAEPALYETVRAAHRGVEWIWSAQPLGFSRAVAAGLDAATMPWTLLLNSDMELGPRAVASLAAERAEDVFAIGASIEQRSAGGRAEETGFLDWYSDGSGVHVFHAPAGEQPRETLFVSGGAGLFRTQELRRYVAGTACYDPFYWEDAEWGVRAWHEGWRCLFAPAATARHRHRATVAKYYSEAEIARITARNAVLFAARNAIGSASTGDTMRRVCDLGYASQRELAHTGIAWDLLCRRAWSVPSRLPPLPTVDASDGPVVVQGGLSHRRGHRRASRPCALVVSPYCVFPPRHGAGRRTAELVSRLAREFDVALVCDEATLHDSRSFTGFDGLCDVALVQRPADPPGIADIGARMARHTHAHLLAAVAASLRRLEPELVQVEHAEIAQLVAMRSPGQRWVLSLHDAVRESDFSDPASAAAFMRAMQSFDAVTVCSPEDAAITRHPRVTVLPNGAKPPRGGYVPSHGATILFVGPFRYANNLEGIVRFLEDAFPAVRATVPEARVLILGGDESSAAAARPPFRQPGVEVLGHQEDVERHFRDCALTINPIAGIRGSAIKVIESLMNGRACVSLRDGARGLDDLALRGLVVHDDFHGLASAVAGLLRDVKARHGREAPDEAMLRPMSWDSIALRQRALFMDLIHGAAG